MFKSIPWSIINSREEPSKTCQLSSKFIYINNVYIACYIVCQFIVTVMKQFTGFNTLRLPELNILIFEHIQVKTINGYNLPVSTIYIQTHSGTSVPLYQTRNYCTQYCHIYDLAFSKDEASISNNV